MALLSAGPCSSLSKLKVQFLKRGMRTVQGQQEISEKKEQNQNLCPLAQASGLPQHYIS